MEALALEQSFGQEEIAIALEEMGSDKSPGPDGFNAMYIKAMWKYLHQDFNSCLTSFYVNATLPKGINSSFIALVLKTINPTTLSYF